MRDYPHRHYPPVGSRWELSIGPDIPRTVFEVIASGHGIVALKDLESAYALSIDILTWHRGVPYNPVLKPTAPVVQS